jgi:hypothetical protein
MNLLQGIFGGLGTVSDAWPRMFKGCGSRCTFRMVAPKFSPSTQTKSSSAPVGTAKFDCPGGAYARARTPDRLPTINGVEFMQSPILAESVVGVGAVRMEISVVSIEDDKNVIKKKKQQTNPIVVLLGVGAVVFVAYAFLFADEESAEVEKIPTDVPALWETSVKACPIASPDQALMLAGEKWLVALGKAERRPFRVQDGVSAVPLFETAAACFRQANDKDRAAEATRTADDLRAKVAEGYRAHQVRLEHALAVGDLVMAQREVRTLRAFTEKCGGKYVSWLADQDRKLQLKLAQQKKT